MANMEISMWSVLKNGGPMLYPIAICSVLAFAVIGERWNFFRTIEKIMGEFSDRIFLLVRQQKIKEAVTLSEQNQHPLARIYKDILLIGHASSPDLRRQLDVVFRNELIKLKLQLNILEIIIYTAPLLGILGTVLGMTRGFLTTQFRAETLAPVSTGELSLYMWQALISTVSGLVVMIPAIIAFGFFSYKTQLLIINCEKKCQDLIYLLTHVEVHEPSEEMAE